MLRCPSLVVPGVTYFFTVRLSDQTSDLLVRKVGLLRDAVRLTQQNHPFVIDAAVILPNRMHMIWTLPPGDPDYATRWHQIKTSFARHAVPQVGLALPPIWQRRFWEVPVATPQEFQQYAEEIARAPVVEGLVDRPELWRFSSHWAGHVDGPVAATA